MEMRIPETNWISKASPKQEPKFHQDERLEGVARSTAVELRIETTLLLIRNLLRSLVTFYSLLHTTPSLPILVFTQRLNFYPPLIFFCIINTRANTSGSISTLLNKRTLSSFLMLSFETKYRASFVRSGQFCNIAFSYRSRSKLVPCTSSFPVLHIWHY